MKQEPDFVFGNAYGAYFGVGGQHEFHGNAAFQIVLGGGSDVVVTDEEKFEYIGKIVLIRPLTKTKTRCDGRLTHLYLSPRLGFALDLADRLQDTACHVLTSTEKLPFDETLDRSEIIEALDRLEQDSTNSLDPRLVAALEYLNQNLDNPSILTAAKRSGLSRSRMRTLAREQLGVPLSIWVTWRKIVEANKALSAGANLSEAALVGCFADQAHFSRTMKRMLGVTPTKALQIYA